MIPQFSLRQIFLAIIAVSLLVVCLAGAVRGNLLAIVIIGGLLVFAAVLPLTLAAVYWLAMLLARMGAMGARQPTSTPAITSDTERPS